MQEGIVYKSTGSWYVIKSGHQFIQARLKGKHKIDKSITSTNPIAVGDKVRFQWEENSEGQQAVVSEILQRENYIVRVAPQNRHQQHILAANLDQAIIIATLHHPRTSTGFIDRFLITAEAYHIPAVIVINKTDLLDDEDKRLLMEWKQLYEEAGYPVHTLSALQEPIPKSFMTLLLNKQTLVCGHSGVGKSTLLNKILPVQQLKTDVISASSGKGQHTTTFAEMFDLPEGGTIIDTPGVKELGLIAIEPEELAHYFPEMRAIMPDCKFNNCIHKNEPGCAVQMAVKQGRIHEERYINYLNILDSLSS